MEIDEAPQPGGAEGDLTGVDLHPLALPDPCLGAGAGG